MVANIPAEKRVQKRARAALQKQASDLVIQERQQYIEVIALRVEANKLCIKAHRIRLEARDVQRDIRARRMTCPESPDLEALERQRQTLCRTADELEAHVVQLLAQAMRLRARLTIIPPG